MKFRRPGLARGARLDHGPTATNQGAHCGSARGLLLNVVEVLIKRPVADRRAIISLSAAPWTRGDLAVVHHDHRAVVGEHDTPLPILKKTRKIFDAAAIAGPAGRNDSGQKGRI